MSSYLIRDREFASTTFDAGKRGFVAAILEGAGRTLALLWRRATWRKRRDDGLRQIAELHPHVQEDLGLSARTDPEIASLLRLQEQRSWLTRPICD